MSLNTVISSFQTLFNRSDCSAAQAQVFVLNGIARMQRVLRLQCMERQIFISSTAPMDGFTVPNDLLEIIDVQVEDPCTSTGFVRPLDHIPYRKLLQIPEQAWPQGYDLWKNAIFIRGAVLPNQPVSLSYYGNFSAFASPDSDNEITAMAPDLCVYAALTYAGDQFQHPATSAWKDTYATLLADTQNVADSLKNNGGPMAIATPYGWNY